MKITRLLTIAATITIAFALTACEKNNSSSDLSASTESSGTLVSRTALVDALWGLAEEPDANAQCIVDSSFTIEPANGFMIMTNAEETDYNMSAVVIVSSINLGLTDPATDGRGASCTAGGELQYIVTSSEEAPIDIEVSEDIIGQRSLETVAGDEPTPYPESCNIVVHFEMQGTALANTDTDTETDEVTDSTDPDSTEDTYAAISISSLDTEAEDEETDDDTSDNEDVVEDDNADDTEEVAQEDEAEEGDGDETGEQYELADDGTAYSLKLVIDGYDCVNNDF